MEITKEQWTKNALDLYSSEHTRQLGKTMLSSVKNRKMIDFKTLVCYPYTFEEVNNMSCEEFKEKRWDFFGRKFSLTISFTEEIFASRKGNINKITGYFKWMGDYPTLCIARGATTIGRAVFGYGYFQGTFDVNKIKRIKINFKNDDKILAAKKLLAKIHPNIWQGLQQKLKDYINGVGEEPSIIANNGANLRYKDITTYFRSWQRETKKEELKKAIEETHPNKTEEFVDEYKFKRYANTPSGRDISIEVKNGNAWFSSEYPDCGNGDYWLLINPTTAVFCETD